MRERNLKDLDLNLLLIFDSIYRCNSISRAAQSLNMSQPAVSNALSRLRQHFDDRLFLRADRGVRPTPLAISMAGPISEALRTLRTGMRAEAPFDMRSSARAFRIVLHDYNIPSVLVPLVKELDDPASRCTIQVLSPDWQEPYERLLQGEADLMIDVYPQEHVGLNFQPLGFAEPVCVVRKDHPTIGHSITREQFGAVGHAMLAREVRARLQMASMVMTSSIHRRQVCELPNAADLATTVAMSDLLALMPLRYASIVAPIYGLRVLAPPFPIPKLPIFMAWQAERDGDPGQGWLRQQVARIFQEDTAGLDA